ncbi:MAG: hypothetical protein PHX34_05830 [Candidatus Shapirobacteria bacterium]|nr:hypothetical protein [Candidatus Shapirobacteria bacterium]
MLNKNKKEIFLHHLDVVLGLTVFVLVFLYCLSSVNAQENNTNVTITNLDDSFANMIIANAVISFQWLNNVMFMFYFIFLILVSRFTNVPIVKIFTGAIAIIISFTATDIVFYYWTNLLMALLGFSVILMGINRIR